MSEKRTIIDWDALEPHFRAGIRSLRDIGKEFGCSDAAIIKHARNAGWTRNLAAKVKAKADAKVAQALVAAERATEPQAKLTEAVRIEVESEVQARVRLTHRTDINRSKKVTNRLLAALEVIAVSEVITDTQRSARAEGESVPVLTLKEHVGILKQLVETQKALVAMEREAYGIAHMQEDGEDEGDRAALDPRDAARRIAFALARAAHLMPPAQPGQAAA